jgi:hypothetical protein
MYLTITQNSALYLVQHTPSKGRSALFLRRHAADRNQSRNLRRRTLVDADGRGRKELPLPLCRRGHRHLWQLEASLL